MTEIRGALTMWGLTLTEPLLPACRRAQAETGLVRAHHAWPDRVQLFFAGFTSGLLQTFLDSDPWRHLSGRCGGVTVGSTPPSWGGAVRADGSRFGVWRDAADLVPSMSGHPADDPRLAVVADGLSGEAAAIVAAAGYGWKPCLAMIEAVYGEAAAEMPAVPLHPDASYRRAVAEHVVLGACADAARWVLHRRRLYMGPSDDWPADCADRWAWRANHPEHRIADLSIASEVALFRVRHWAPQDVRVGCWPDDDDF